MMKLNIIKSCYVCGEVANELGNICQSCKNQSPIIDSNRCSICGIPLVSENSICMRCRNIDYSFESNISLFVYKNIPKDIFYQYKFKRNREIGFWYASLLFEIIQNDYHDYIIVPSPYRFKKKIKKGWDQVEFISMILKKKYNLKVEHILKRSGSIDQKKLDLEDRKNNLKGKIKIRRKAINLKNEKILFLDDIFTTGATANECCKTLIMKSPSIIKVMTIAID